MSISLVLALLSAMVGTSFLSGIFGMAGGMVLMGILLALLPVPEAMALHAVAQMASNGWRGVLWIAHVRWRAVAVYLGGCLLALVAWSFVRYVPSKPLALILLGLTPFLVRVLPAGLKPDPERASHGMVYGSASMSLMLMTGVGGPLVDTYFLGGNLERREIVATKAVCQVFSHAAKLLYFSALVEQAAAVELWLAALVVMASMAGTTLAKPVLERLSDTQYRRYATHIITAIACGFLAQGGWQLAFAAR